MNTSRPGLLASLALLLAAPAAYAEEPARAKGTIEVDDARVEVLSERLPVGERIDLPEGWFRIEEEGTEEREVGSFTVASADARTPVAPAPVVTPSAPPAEGAASPAQFGARALRAEPACRDERNAYLRELWRESGIEDDDPDALLRGLDAGDGGPATGYYWFALSTDAFRNLAWSSDLRGRARALERCVRDQGR